MRKHLSILEDSNSVITRLWWTIFTKDDAQREYWRRDRRRELTRWINAEKKVARDWMLRNIGPVAGAADGVVIASPSTGEVNGEPDYYVSAEQLAVRDDVLMNHSIHGLAMPL